MNSDLVSVILPVFNSEKYIRDTIDSVLNQTYKNIEIIIVDDCSTDSTHNIIREYESEYSNIKSVFLNVNMGVAHARNTAMEMASGRFLAFIDSDDLWNSQKIEKQVKSIINGVEFSFTAIDIIDENNRIIKSKRRIHEIVTYKRLLKNTEIATSSVLLDRTKILDTKMPNLRSGQDYACWLKILRIGKIAYGIDEPLVSYRITSNSLSKNKLKSIQQVWFIQSHFERIPFVHRVYNLVFFVINNIKKKIF